MNTEQLWGCTEEERGGKESIQVLPKFGVIEWCDINEPRQTAALQEPGSRYLCQSESCAGSFPVS